MRDCELEITLSPEENDTCQFLIMWKVIQSHYPLDWSLPLPTASGYLKRWDRKSTHVIVKPNSPIVSYMLSSLILFAGILMAVWSLDLNLRLGKLTIEPLAVSILSGAVVVPYWLQLRALENQLPAIVGATLHPERFGWRRLRNKHSNLPRL
jgi:hypothetical protein